MQYVSIMTLEDIADEFVSLCYDFHYLRHRRNEYHDPREERTRQMFLACGNRNRMETALHGIHIGDYTLNRLLEMKGFAENE